MRPADSVEHVLPQKVAKAILGVGPWVVIRKRRLFNVDGNVQPEATKLPICSECNNAFLNHEFEQPWAAHVIALSRGNRVLLNPVESAGIGRYLYKTFLMKGLHARPALVPAAVVSTFRATSAPPPDWSVWVFRAQRSPLLERGIDPGLLPMPVTTTVLGVTAASLASLNVIAALGWVVCDPHSSLIELGLAEYEAQGLAARIWPPNRTNNLSWPMATLRPSAYLRLIQPLAVFGF